jgi:katanin p80 WD40 repeat-containing subunit B1
MILALTLPQICRHAIVSLEILLDLIKIFGPVIHSTLSASSTVGVDIQAEQRYAH